MQANTLIDRIEQTAPLAGAASWDACGVHVAGTVEAIGKLALMLDPLPSTIARAVEWGADFILSHHPLSREPRFLNKLDAHHEVVHLVMGSGAWLYAAHTSLDANPTGPAGWLARDLGLVEPEVLEPTHASHVVGVTFTLEEGAPGAIAVWQAMPQVLDIQVLSEGEYFLICYQEQWEGIRDRIIEDIDETPAFLVHELALAPKTLGLGLAGDLAKPMAWNDFCALLAQVTGREHWLLYGEPAETVSRVAYCTGSGSSLAAQAEKSGAQVYITGEMRYHTALECRIPTIDVGHFSLEEEMMRRFAVELSQDEDLASVEVEFFPGVDPQRPVSIR